MKTLQKELATLLNRHCLENESNTPDFILAEYMMNCLTAFNRATRARGQWYGRMDVPGRGSLPYDEITLEGTH